MGTKHLRLFVGFFVLLIPIWADSDADVGAGSVSEQLVQNGDTNLGSKVNYTQMFTDKTMNLLSEAVNALGQVKDDKSKQWLEVFVFKLGQFAVELEESSNNDDKLVLPTNEEKIPTPMPVVQKLSKPSGKMEVTSPQVIDVLPPNDQIQDHQVVTKPGIISNVTEEDDDIVQQLHEHSSEPQKKYQQTKVALHHHVPPRNQRSHMDEENGDDHDLLDEKETKLLIEVLKEMEKYPDLLDDDRFRTKGYNGIIGARESNSYQQQPDITSETDDFVNFANLDPHDLEFYLTSTASPLHERTNKPKLSINKIPLAKQPSEHEGLPLMEDPNFLHYYQQQQHQQQRHDTENVYHTWFLPYLFQKEKEANLKSNTHHLPHQNSHSRYNEHLPENKDISEKYHHNQYAKNYRLRGKFAHSNSHGAPTFPFEAESFRHKLIPNHERWVPDQNSVKRQNGMSRLHASRKYSPHEISQTTTPHSRELSEEQLIGGYPKHRLRIPQTMSSSMEFKLVDPSKSGDGDIGNFKQKFDSDLERELRAGKVVILSDSVVRTNFTKRPNKAEVEQKHSKTSQKKEPNVNAM